MKEIEFRRFLENSDMISSKEKGVNSRISRANTVETVLGRDLDAIVSDDEKMYEALLLLKSYSRERSGNLQNALRWYFQFVNGKNFPRLAVYEKERAQRSRD